jgi:Ca-activated chloride channel family protein
VPVSTIAFGTDYGVDRATLEEIADETGGSYSEAASAAELEQVYADLGSQIGYTTEPKDISPWFVRGGVMVLLVGAIMSLFWTNRLV